VCCNFSPTAIFVVDFLSLAHDLCPSLPILVLSSSLVRLVSLIRTFSPSSFQSVDLQRRRSGYLG
jgi:hypothetical protein